jgi:hypothetical protein
MSSALIALRSAPALRSLDITVSNPGGLAYLPLLTQLTGLSVGWCWGLDGARLRPLVALPHLVSLQLRGVDLCNTPAPCALPPNLTRLELQGGCTLGRQGWTQHVAGCKQLQELFVVITNGGDLHTHPTLVMEALAGQLTQLRKLVVEGEDLECEWGRQQLVDVLGQLQQDAAAQQDADSDNEDGGNVAGWAVQLPQLAVGEGQGWEVPEAYVAVPPPNMGDLSALQHLEWLVLSTDAYWRDLAACRQLQTLPELHVSAPPPAGVTFPGVTRLEVTTSTSQGDTLVLLAAFPALKELKLDVVLKTHRDPVEEVSLRSGHRLAVATKQLSNWLPGLLRAAQATSMVASLPLRQACV